MDESSVEYQLLYEYGRALGFLEGYREVLLALAEERLGCPSEAVKAELLAIDDIDELTPIMQRLFRVSSWDDLIRSE